MTNITTVKNWFKTGLKPTQDQFWAFFDSIWFKDEQIPAQNIEGLAELLNDKADAEALTNHKNDANAHADLFSQINASGRFLINRNNLMFFADTPIAGDTVTGTVEGEYLNAGTFYGGDPLLMSSYVEINSVGAILGFESNVMGFGDRLRYQLSSEVSLRVYSCSGYLAIALKYKRPGELTFSEIDLYGELLSPQDGEDPIYQASISYLELTMGTIIKISDINGSFEDSATYLIP